MAASAVPVERPDSSRTRRLQAARARARRRRIVGGLVATVVTGMVVGGLAVARHYDRTANPNPFADDPAVGPTSVLPTGWRLPAIHGGHAVALADFRGRPTVVNFFASWCDQCERELPSFAKTSRTLAGRVNFVGVNSFESGDGPAMAQRFGIDSWPLARDIDGSNGSGLHDALGGNGMPLTAFYDAGGRLVTTVSGSLPGDALPQAIQQVYGIGG